MKKEVEYQIGIDYDEGKFLKLIKKTNTIILRKTSRDGGFTQSGFDTYKLLVENKHLKLFTDYILKQETY